MNPKVKKLWIAALKSGKYSQTKLVLKDYKGYCCLGVLCDLYAKTQKKKGFYSNDDGVTFQFHDTSRAVPYQTANLPKQVQKWSGVNSHLGYYKSNSKKDVSRSLSGGNDNGKTFKQIAKIIEAKF